MQRSGFTIVELLISIGVFAIITASALPAYQSFSKRDNLIEGMSIVVSAFAKAEALSRAVSSNTGWGVAVQTSSVVIFNGISLSSSTPALRQTIPLPAGVMASGSSSFAFTKFYGMPQAVGAVTLSVPGGGTSTITINAQGLISH